MTEKLNLGAELAKIYEWSENALPKASEPEPVADKTVVNSREGKKMIAGHFNPEVSKQLKQLALEKDSNVQALLGEAINDLFIKYGKLPIV